MATKKFLSNFRKFRKLIRDDQFSDMTDAWSKATRQQKSEFIEKVLKKTTESFIPEEVFDAHDLQQHCGDVFLKRIYYGFRKKVVHLNVFNKDTLKRYVLHKNMNDTGIKENTGSAPIDKSRFWAVWYLLIIDQNRGKEIFGYELQKDKIYLLHVALSTGEVYTVRFIYSHKENRWKYYARDFDCKGGIWGEGSVFLYF
jgi:hypothetical protein